MSKVTFAQGSDDSNAPDLIRVHCTVTDIYVSRVTGYRSDRGAEVVSQTVSWFVKLDPGGFSVPVGPEKPKFTIGQVVDIIIAPPDMMQE